MILPERDRICFILVHNHKFEHNLIKLEDFYRSKFSNLYHLMPFYSGPKENVIGVNETSHCFQGYFAQGAKSFIRSRFDYYVFCADDMLLHPYLNALNLTEALQINQQTGYIKSLTSLADAHLRWPATASALVALARKNGVNWEQELPSFEEAAQAFQRHGLEVGCVGLKQLSHGIRFKEFVLMCFFLLKRLQKMLQDPEIDLLGMPYPMAMSYSDFIVVPASAIERFCHYCGVFAATGLFVEVAIPTAMILTCPSIRTESQIEWLGREFWNEDIAETEKAHGQPEKQPYDLPAKLSKWG